MDSTQPAADRVRPILKAMERSIDAARMKRLHAGSDPLESLVTPHDPSSTDAPPTRLKARPKRASRLPIYNDNSPIRSQAS